MNIACDARALVGQRTGVGTWTERVMGGLARRGLGSIHLAAPKPIRLEIGERHPNLMVVPAPRRPTIGPVWLNTTVPRQLEALSIDVWIGALAILPNRCPVPAISTVHDLTPRTHPARHTLANRIIFKLFLRRSLRSAHTVVAISSATEGELLAAFPWVAPKLERIGNGVDEWFSPAPPGDDGKAIRERFAGGHRYLLHLGTIEPRKGISDLVDAWEQLQAELPDPPDLVIAGGQGWQTSPILDRIHSSASADLIHLPGYVSREDARALLRHAEAFALASEVEGFGLPLAEAISCGTPSVATGIPALRESGGDAALFCPPSDPGALAAALKKALEPNTAAQLRERALNRAPSLRWDTVIEAWADLLEGVAQRSSR